MLSKKLIAWLGAGILAAGIVPATHAAVRHATTPSKLAVTAHPRQAVRSRSSTVKQATTSTHHSLRSSAHAARTMSHSTAKTLHRTSRSQAKLSTHAKKSNAMHSSIRKNARLPHTSSHSVTMAVTHKHATHLSTSVRHAPSHAKVHHTSARAM